MTNEINKQATFDSLMEMLFDLIEKSGGGDAPDAYSPEVSAQLKLVEEHLREAIGLSLVDDPRTTP
jgi:hypothetical protein